MRMVPRISSLRVDGEASAGVNGTKTRLRCLGRPVGIPSGGVDMIVATLVEGVQEVVDLVRGVKFSKLGDRAVANLCIC